jgi:hypothetical protein
VAVAILGATASAVITTDRIDAVFGGGAVEKTPSPTPTPISYKTVTSLDKSLSFSVPSTWSARDGSYDVTDDQGVAVITGTQVEKSISFQHDNAYVAASVDATSIDGTVRPSSGRSAFLDAILDEGDWTKEGCILGSEPARTKSGWLIESRYWIDCAAVRGQRVWEIAGFAEDGTAFLMMQVGLNPTSPASITDEILASVSPNPQTIPSTARTTQELLDRYEEGNLFPDTVRP